MMKESTGSVTFPREKGSPAASPFETGVRESSLRSRWLNLLVGCSGIPAVTRDRASRFRAVPEISEAYNASHTSVGRYAKQL